MRYTIWQASRLGTEKVDTFTSRADAEYNLHEYRMAFGTLPGQHNHGKVLLWCGTKAGKDVLHGDHYGTRAALMHGGE